MDAERGAPWREVGREPRLDIPRNRTRSPAGPQKSAFRRGRRTERVLQESRPLEEDKAAVGRRVPFLQEATRLIPSQARSRLEGANIVVLLWFLGGSYLVILVELCLSFLSDLCSLACFL